MSYIQPGIYQVPGVDKVSYKKFYDDIRVKMYRGSLKTAFVEGTTLFYQYQILKLYKELYANFQLPEQSSGCTSNMSE